MVKSSLVLYRRLHRSAHMNKNAGFTLIEVLIAMLVLGVGLLGLAGLQASSLRNNQSAYNRSQATELAYDLADRMRANIAGIATYTAMLPTDAAAQANCVTVSTTCTTNVMAQNDLYQWNLAVTTALPSGQGFVCLDSTPGDGASAVAANCDEAGNTYAIKIWWDDARSGAASQRFVVSFQLL